MPPEQCPSCGRFLSRSFVERATDSPRACPRCDAEVSFGDAAADAPPSSVPTATVPVRGGRSGDVAPAPPRARPHPLDDWDADRRGRSRPTAAAPDAPVVAGVALAGAVVGALVAGRRSRPLGAVLGGATAALVHRTTW